MRIGVSLPDPSGPSPMTALREELQRAADQGFASAWMSNIFGVDALTALAVAGSQVPGIEVGTAVVPTYPRHPAVLAQQARTVAAAVDGRLVLGIGLSHKIVIEDMFGYDFRRPVLHMREYLAVLLPLLDGQPVSFIGTTVRANIGLTTPSPGRVPVVVAALGAQMLRLAGEQTDGTVLWMTGPATVRDHIVPVITAAAESAGRPRPRVVCLLPVCVTGDSDAARERAARVFTIYGDLPSYRAMLDREGAAGPADVAIVGDEDTVSAQIGTLAEAGVTDFVAVEYAGGADGARTRAFLRTLLT
ncbi:MAG TPA: LLM class F420-dependent oxidoreductase [Streptosporangiaceae bacterium]|nr:LLM class F420-dependent oxidoreductase [Streptosporangiaceae bacterium]